MIFANFIVIEAVKLNKNELILQSDNYLKYIMELDLLTAISPIDGRYRGKAGALASYFSEFALIKYRVQVEIEYFITLCELPLPQLTSFDHARFASLRAIYQKLFGSRCRTH